MHPDRVLIVIGTLAFDEFRGGLSLRADQVLEMDEVRELMANLLQIEVDEESLRSQHIDAGEFSALLQELLAGYRDGRARIQICFHGAGASGRLFLGEEWRVRPADALINKLTRLPGVSATSEKSS